MDTNVVKMNDSVFYVGVNDRKTYLFESLWPLERGVAYNSYLIMDEKVALVDTVEKTQMMNYVEKIAEVLGEGNKIDYLIINHMEPDHSGSIKEIVLRYPEIKIVGNTKTFDYLRNFFGIDRNLYEVKDGDELDLGSRKLKFYFTPMVHWPETMMTYDMKDKILFAGDAFGSFGSLDGGIYDDQVDMEILEEEMRRYYSNIVGKYGPMVQRALKKLEGVDIKMICATHGPIWKHDLNWVISLYDKMSRFVAENGVVLVYSSMYGNTEKMADEIAKSLKDEGVETVKVYDASKTHLSYILSDIYKYKGVILGSCAYNTVCHPPMEALLHKLDLYGTKDRLAASFGTYTWSGGGVKTINSFIDKLKWEYVADSVEAKCSPKKEDIEKCREIGKAMASKLRTCCR